MTNSWVCRWFTDRVSGCCLLCQASTSLPLCQPCVKGLPGLEPGCAYCALPLKAGDPLCGRCLQQPPAWTSASIPLRYAFPIDRLVVRFKFQRSLVAGAALAQAMLRGPQPRPPSRPWLVPVPLHWTRERWRGFNQARELALLLSRNCGWPLAPGRLLRSRRTPAQAGLGRRQRQRNLRRAFRWHGPALAGRSLLLVDDVMTTGATLRACASALDGAGWLGIWVSARALDWNR